MTTSHKTHILLVEDDQNLGQILKEYLEIKGFKVDLASNGQVGLDYFKSKAYDFCILDIMMPVMDGFELAENIRKMNKQVPLLFLSAKAMKDDRIKGLELGADDYLCKPFSMEELLLRIKAILKRSTQYIKEETRFEIGSYIFDYTKQEIKLHDIVQNLTTKENALLYLLCKKKNDILTRDEALNNIWGDDSYYTARSMDVFISKLRKYLSKDPNIQILNVHGSGFKLID